MWMFATLFKKVRKGGIKKLNKIGILTIQNLYQDTFCITNQEIECSQTITPLNTTSCMRFIVLHKSTKNDHLMNL